MGLEHELSRQVTVQATYFDQSLEDLIQYTFAPPNPGDPNYFNVAGATSSGVEVDVAVRAAGFEGGASYTWLRTEVTNSGFDSGPSAELVNGETLLRRPAHTWAVRGARALGEAVRIHSSLAFVGARADRSFDPVTFAATREELPGYALWTLGAAWELGRGIGSLPDLAVSARAENLLDESYEEAWGFAAPGRQLFVGLSVGFGGGD